jgi:nicotinamide riboside transporter PnuC
MENTIQTVLSLITFDNTVQWVGCVTGVLGSLLLALNNRASGYGFVLFLISNCFWIAFGLKNQVMSIVLMQLVFTATSLIGVYKWRATFKSKAHQSLPAAA